MEKKLKIKVDDNDHIKINLDNLNSESEELNNFIGNINNILEEIQSQPDLTREDLNQYMEAYIDVFPSNMKPMIGAMIRGMMEKMDTNIDVIKDSDLNIADRISIIESSIDISQNQVREGSCNVDDIFKPFFDRIGVDTAPIGLTIPLPISDAQMITETNNIAATITQHQQEEEEQAATTNNNNNDNPILTPEEIQNINLPNILPD